MNVLLNVGVIMVGAAIALAQNRLSEPAPLIQDARVIYSQEGTTIQSMLLKDDKFVVVRRGGVISEYVDNSVLSLAEDLDLRVRGAHLIAIAELARTESILAEEGSWIRSKLTLRLVQVIKRADPSLFDRDGYVTVDHDGGELTLTKVRVRAGRYYELFPKQRYLVFLRSPRQGYVGFIGMQLKVSEDERIVPIDLSDGNVATAESPLHGLLLHNVIAEFKRRLTP